MSLRGKKKKQSAKLFTQYDYNFEKNVKRPKQKKSKTNSQNKEMIEGKNMYTGLLLGDRNIDFFLPFIFFVFEGEYF